jgi:hypothetical protein
MSKLEIPPTNTEQNKKNEVAFLQAYGKSYRQMRKDELAQMIMNQSLNVMKFKDENYKVAQLAVIYKRQRDYFLKLCRKKNGKND